MIDPDSVSTASIDGLTSAAATPMTQREAALGPLAGRILLQVNPRSVSTPIGQLDADRSGLVLCGEDALKKASKLRADGFGGAILVDPAVYAVASATETSPFPEVDDGTLPFDGPLGRSVVDQTGARTTAVLTPTGYIRGGDLGALKAAVSAVSELDDPRVIFTVPVDVDWLNDAALSQLIACLRQVSGRKAVILGGQKDPLGRFKNAVANLCRLIREVPHVGVLRTDLAAFGAFAHGAEFTAFGYTSGLRHTVPPGEKADHGPFNLSSPHVLFPELMRYFLGSTLARRFAAVRAPVCHCAACGGRGLDEYPDRTAPRETQAAEHNVAVLMEWLRMLTTVESGSARIQWWQQRCKKAVARCQEVNAEIDQPKAFKAEAQLIRWAELAA